MKNMNAEKVTILDFLDSTGDYQLGSVNIHNIKTAKSEKYPKKYNETAMERIKNLKSKSEV